MNRTNEDRVSTADREMVLTRVVNAPPELVWKAWTDPEHVGQWWGPDGFTTTTRSIEVRPGGVWSFVMHGPEGTDYPNRIVYLEIEEPTRLVYKHTGEEDVEAALFQTTVTFDDLGGKTKVTLRSVFPSAEELGRLIREFNALEGGKQHLARLDAYVSQLK
jgi:uncharacterized protein YndB with AHSA1/START domain